METNNDGPSQDKTPKPPKQTPAKPSPMKQQKDGTANKEKKRNNYQDEPKGDGIAAEAPVADWSDMKMFDDDHDPDWFEEEEKRLAQRYGGRFIKVKYTEQGKPGYFCEICLAEMNAKKSLESHCEGMKHLKKKALFEKSQQGEPEAEENDGLQGGWNDDSKSPRGKGSKIRDRSPLHRDEGRSDAPRGRGENRGRRGLGGNSSDRSSRDSRFQERSGRNDDRRGRGNGRFDGPAENRFGPPNDRFGPPNDRFGPPNDRFGPPNDRFGPPNDRFGPPNDRFGPPNDQFGPPNDRFGPPNDRFGPPNDRFGPPNDRLGRPDDRFGRPDDRFGRPDDRPGPAGDGFRSSSNGSAVNYDPLLDPHSRPGSSNDNYGGPVGGNRYNSRMDSDRPGATASSGWPAPTVPQPVAPVPTEKLNGGTTGILLTKLASCYIKDEEDADLALSVISSLSSSLREYNTKKGEKKIAELLMEAELKLNTLKALKVGLKLLKKSGGSSNSSGSATPSAPPAPSYQLPVAQGLGMSNKIDYQHTPRPSQYSRPY